MWPAPHRRLPFPGLMLTDGAGRGGGRGGEGAVWRRMTATHLARNEGPLSDAGHLTEGKLTHGQDSKGQRLGGPGPHKGHEQQTCRANVGRCRRWGLAGTH